MKLAEYLKYINKSKTPMRMERWMDLKQYYLSMYSHYMLKLYDMGYIADPTRFNESEIIQSLVELGIYDFKDEYGIVLVTSQIAAFVRDRAKGKEEFDFLDILYQVLKYKEYCLELDKQYELNQNELRFSFALKEGIMITSLCTIDYNKGVFSALCKDGYCLEEVSINSEIFRYAMKTLDIPESEFTDGVLIEGMSVEDTVSHLALILEGRVNLSGKYGKKLRLWLDSNTENGKGLYYHTCRYFSNELTEYINNLIESYGDTFAIMYKDKLYYTKLIENYRFPCSMFVCVSSLEEDDMVDTSWNTLYGYTGEAYTKEYLDSQYIDYVGIPITVNVGGTELQVYDSSQLVMAVEKDSWFSFEGMSFYFDESYNFNNILPKGSIEYELVNAYIEAQRGGIYELKASMYSLKDIKQLRKKVLPRLVKIFQ